MNRAEREYIVKLKQTEPFTGFREPGSDGVECKVQILGRGETAFFQRGDRALLLEVLAGQGVIFSRSIRRWDDGKVVTDEEREVVVDAVYRALARLGAKCVVVVRE
jgi:hypothetical protein